MATINEHRLLERISALGKIGRDAGGRRTRLAADGADKAGRDAVAGWMREAGLQVITDRIGNIFGVWETDENKAEKAVMTGSHIDTVINAGQYDGCYGVLAGIEVLQSLKEAGGTRASRPRKPSYSCGTAACDPAEKPSPLRAASSFSQTPSM